ncbi:MAG: hypothetical protein ABL929_11170 [Ferruginibacter sp.]
MTYKTRPTAAVITNFVDSFNKDNFYDSENYLAAIKLTKAFPNNDDYKNIFIKVNFINGAFKTTIGDTFGVAKQVFEKVKNIDSRLKQGDTSLVNEIALYKVSKSKKVRNNFSFATKFCHCHKPNLFPINDKYVRNSLFDFNKNFKFSKFTKKSLLDYNIFLIVLADFRKIVDDKKIDFATIDRFLWALGRESERKKIKAK